MPYTIHPRQPYPSYERALEEPKRTVEGKAINAETAMLLFATGNLENKIQTYYDDAFFFPDEEIKPDFNQMTRLEKLELYNVKKAQYDANRLKLEQGDETATLPSDQTGGNQTGGNNSGGDNDDDDD